jgi:hypothetical protein
VAGVLVIKEHKMNTQKIKSIFIFSIALLAILASSGFCDYKIVWSTIDGGGGVSSGGTYIVRGTIGQPDAAYSEGGNYELLGGFWSGVPVCVVDFRHFARFAEYWLETGSDLPADLYEDDVVDLYDLELFTDEWLYHCPYDWPLR